MKNELYRELKQYIHNELGISKDNVKTIDGVMRDIKMYELFREDYIAHRYEIGV